MHFRRFANLRLAVIAGLGLASVLSFAGCDKKVEGPAPAANATPAATPGKATSAVGVVNIDRVMEALGWTRILTDNLQALGGELGRERDALLNQMNAMLQDKRNTLSRDAKLTTEQAQWLNEGKLDKLEKILTDQQRAEYVQLANAMQNFINQAPQRAEMVARGWATEMNSAYVTSMQSSFRRAADNAGVSIVLPSGAALYSNPSIDLTDKVVDDLKGTQPPAIKAFPRLGMKVDPGSTTQPSTPAPTPTPAPATTKPTR